MRLQLKRYVLPHDGVIRGARGHKAQVVPAGTKVWCIVYGTLMYWAVYLDEKQARRVMDALENCESARRSIPFKTMIEWNFSSRFPKKVARTKED